jgi:hypothetical protein
MKNEKLRALFPALTDEELQSAEETLDRYLAIAWEISEELREGKPPD